MKVQILIFLVVILSLNCYSQISFEKGYYINNSNHRVDCLIKNVDWLNNPTEFEYKLLESSEQKTLTINSVKEFGILNISKYIRYRVNIDRSSEELDELSNIQNPVFEEEELFLKVLVEGKASLYLFEDKGMYRFFFNKDNSDVEQLIYKSFLTPENLVRKNNSFRQQLWNDLKCKNFSINYIKSIDYKQNELVNLFVKYNECTNSEFINFEEKQKKDLFNLTLRPGFNSSSLLIQNSNYIWKEIDFENELGFRLGIEAEFIMPFNNNKWAIVVEPTYQYFKSEKTIISNKTTGDKIIANVNYNSIEVPFSLRYYIFLSDKSKLFLNGSLILDFCFNSSTELTRADGDLYKSLDTRAGSNFAVGMGYKYNDKYSLELRYQKGKDILSMYKSWNGAYNTLSMVFGYSLF